MATALTLSGPDGYVGGSAQTYGPLVGYASGKNYVLRYSFKTPATGYVKAITFATNFRLNGGSLSVNIRVKVTSSATSHKNAGSAASYDATMTPGELTYVTVNGATLGVYPDSVKISGLSLAPNTTYYIYLFPASTTSSLLYCYDNSGYDYATATAEVTPAASTISLSDAKPTMGDEITISVTRASADLTHTLRYVFGDLSGTIGSSVATSKKWTVPLTFATEIPSSVSGEGTIYCDTYYGTTLLGTTSATFTATVPNNSTTQPKASITVSPVSELESPFSTYYLVGKTKVKVEYTASSEYSTIKSYSASVDGKAYTGNPATSDYLSTSGKVKIIATVTDARGYKTTVTQEITVIPYQKPRAIPYSGQSAVICARCDADGMVSNTGENLLIKAGRSYSAVTIDGVQKNFCMIRYRYKVASASDYSSWVTLLAEDALTSDYVSQVLTDMTLNVKTAYTVQINVVDTLGGSSNATILVGSAAIAFQLGKGKRNVSIGQFCDYSHVDALDIGFTTYFNTGIAKRTIFTGTWAVGQELSSVVSSADVASVALYTVFIAVIGGVPTLCVKHNDVIYGSSLKMTYSETDGVSQLTLNTASSSVTALYALL